MKKNVIMEKMKVPYEFKKEYIEFLAKVKTSLFTEESAVSLLLGLSDII